MNIFTSMCLSLPANVDPKSRDHICEFRSLISRLLLLRFVGGRLSMCYNALDRHVDAGEGGRTAVVWDSAITAQKSKLTYAQLRQDGGCRRVPTPPISLPELTFEQ